LSLFLCFIAVLSSVIKVGHIWPMQLYDLYIKYFKHQAEQHPALQHQDADGKRVFDVIDVEQAFSGIRSFAKEKDFIFRLLIYTSDITDNYTDDAQKIMLGGFIIAHYHSTRSEGPEGFNIAMSKAEKVGDEIIQKMITDSQNSHPLFNNSFNTAQNISIQPYMSAGDSTYSGWLFTFRFSHWFKDCLTPGAPAWGDNGETPHDLSG